MNPNDRDQFAPSSGNSPFIEPRVTPGTNTIRPPRVDRPDLLAPKPPKDAPRMTYPKVRR
jgi:hypothetical protein